MILAESNNRPMTAIQLIEAGLNGQNFMQDNDNQEEEMVSLSEYDEIVSKHSEVKKQLEQLKNSK